MKINSDILNQAGEHVTSYLASNLAPHFQYHSIEHTRAVVNKTEWLCDQLKVSHHKKNIAMVAAWFHDVGYTVTTDEHEIVGVALAEEFLRSRSVDEDEVKKVSAIILSTRYPQRPLSKLEKILCDADMLHISDRDFIDKSELLRKEWSVTRKCTYSDDDWHRLNLEFLVAHTFHTGFCRDECSSEKQKNISRIEALLKGEKEIASIEKLPKKSRTIKEARGVETLFRNSARAHMELSAMADNKANILLGVSTLIVTVLVSFLFRHFVEAPYLVLPTALLLGVCLLTIVMAILATKPKVSKGTFTTEQISRREVNLLFFGNFYKMDLPVYEWGINELIHDKEYLYSSMTKDIYFLGKVLAVKYRYLSIGYTIFMYGIIASVIAFSLSIVLTNGAV